MTNKPKSLVLGAGAWGTALALTLVRNGTSEVYLWGRDGDAVAAMTVDRCNQRYLPGIELPAELNLITGRAFPENIDLLVVAVPFQSLRGILRDYMAATGSPPMCVACASKGLESGTFARADQIVATEYGDRSAFAMLSGPNFAIEVAEQLPAAITVATTDEYWGEALVQRFHARSFRPYFSHDVVGVEIGGAIKNVMAIAAGISDGLNLGANSRAALITRGLAEITRFGTAQGGQIETFMGLSGLGDLVLTCTDDKSRNRRFGLLLAAGASAAQATAEIGLVEGASTVAALVEFAATLEIEMPISEQVAATVTGATAPLEAVQKLLSRDPVAETRRV